MSMWSSWAESTKASLTSALGKTGDALSKAATHKVPKETLPEKPGGVPTTSQVEKETENKTSTEAAEAAEAKRKEFFGNLQAGWSSVVDKTKEQWQVAQGVLEEQQSRLQERINEARHTYYKRDSKLPLDTVALRDAQVVYITDRLITMSHPAMASTVNAEITGERKLAAVGHLFTQRHNGRFMVWNISEVDYETRILDDQVLTFSFPGSPSPPLGLLLKLLMSMEAWLKADDRNVAVVHCLTGKGRTSMVLASFLCWMGQAGFGDIYRALGYIAACKQLDAEDLTIPSQRRYASYFKNMLDGVRPSQPPLMLKRIILSEAPQFTKGPPREDNKAENRPDRLMGCAPYLQLFKAGDLLHTTPASLHYQQSDTELPFVQIADGPVSFNVDIVVQGDILIRCRHLASNKKNRISMFRAAFHTGYVPPKVLRLKKADLDGACSDDRFPEDFFVDLIFEAMDAEEASKMIMEQERQLLLKQVEADTKDEEGEAEADANKTEDNKKDASAETSLAATKHVSAAAYDVMLHRESRFWEVIAARREEHSADTDANQPSDPMWGPTIGRRRDFDQPSKFTAAIPENSQAKQQQNSALETFSIGGELDFLPQEDIQPAPTAVEPKKKDSLMEALMGAISDDKHDSGGGPEVVIFDHTATGSASAAKSNTAETASSEKPDTAPSDTATSETASKATSETTAAAENKNDNVADLLEEENLDLDGGDDDVDALLAGTDDGNFDDLDFDDAELEDLENFLSK